MPASRIPRAVEVLPDVLAPGLRVVFCGTAPGHASKQAGAYYAGRGNLFWPTLHRINLTPRRLAPADYREVLRYGIGLTDINKTEFGSDAELSRAVFDAAGLRAKIERFQPRILAFNSKNAAKQFYDRPTVEYGLQPDTVRDTAIFVLPSTAGLARRHWDIRPWQDLAELVRRAG